MTFGINMSIAKLCSGSRVSDVCREHEESGLDPISRHNRQSVIHQFNVVLLKSKGNLSVKSRQASKPRQSVRKQANASKRAR